MTHFTYISSYSKSRYRKQVVKGIGWTVLAVLASVGWMILMIGVLLPTASLLFIGAGVVLLPALVVLDRQTVREIRLSQEAISNRGFVRGTYFAFLARSKDLFQNPIGRKGEEYVVQSEAMPDKVTLRVRIADAHARQPDLAEYEMTPTRIATVHGAAPEKVLGDIIYLMVHTDTYGRFSKRSKDAFLRHARTDSQVHS